MVAVAETLVVAEEARTGEVRIATRRRPTKCFWRATRARCFFICAHDETSDHARVERFSEHAL